MDTSEHHDATDEDTSCSLTSLPHLEGFANHQPSVTDIEMAPDHMPKTCIETPSRQRFLDASSLYQPL